MLLAEAPARPIPPQIVAAIATPATSRCALRALMKAVIIVSAPSPCLGPNRLPHFPLLDERQRIVHVLREHDGILGDRLHRAVEHLVAGLDDVGAVVGS